MTYTYYDLRAHIKRVILKKRIRILTEGGINS